MQRAPLPFFDVRLILESSRAGMKVDLEAATFVRDGLVAELRRLTMAGLRKEFDEEPAVTCVTLSIPWHVATMPCNCLPR